jgi:hypothetical protein
MPFAGISHLPPGESLPAPIEGDHREAAIEQFADNFIIFLDEFGPALEDADRALSAAAFGEPIGSPQFQAIAGLHVHQMRVGRERVVGSGQKLKHGGVL